MKTFVTRLAALACLSVSVLGQSRPGVGPTLAQSPQFKAASTFIEQDYDRFVTELIALTEIPAPPFKEAQRASTYLRMLQDAGLSDVEQDEEGNVMGMRKGAGTAPMLAIVAHLDTVFPEGTDVRVKRDGTKLMAPGIGDDTRALAMMLTAIRAMNAARVETASDILFVGGVGEEGEGDLRGMKHLIEKGKYKDRIKLFLAIDGGDQSRLVNGALGSKRYRATFKGPGGHSYGAFGLVNPAFAMGNAIQKFGKLKVPTTPKTTFSVGVVGGGTSVNAIPFEAYMDVDMRSESRDELAKVDKQFLAMLQESVDQENRDRSTAQGKITLDVKLIGERPSGETSLELPFTQHVASALSTFGLKPAYSTSSTDSNIPISHGIPALTIGHGGPGGRAHSLDEWTDVEKKAAIRGAQVALLIFLSVAGGGK
jgi:tripeptide aminopeptidase